MAQCPWLQCREQSQREWLMTDRLRQCQSSSRVVQFFSVTLWGIRYVSFCYEESHHDAAPSSFHRNAKSSRPFPASLSRMASSLAHLFIQNCCFWCQSAFIFHPPMHLVCYVLCSQCGSVKGGTSQQQR